MWAGTGCQRLGKEMSPCQHRVPATVMFKGKGDRCFTDTMRGYPRALTSKRSRCWTVDAASQLGCRHNH
jgi:hypothetical protein